TPPMRLRVWAAAALALTIGTVGALLVIPIAGLVVAIFALTVLGLLAGIMHRYASGCDEVRAAVGAYAPRIAVPYAGKVGVHIGMWSPWIDRTEVPWCIVARTPGLFRELAAMYPGTPIVQGAIPLTVRAALYPHGAATNAELIADSAATHVFLGHGDSDKPLSASDRVLQYDIIAVAGQAAIDRFAAAGLTIPQDKLRIIGRPQTEGIAVATGSAPRPATVLYAPTWRHADDQLNVSSLAVADQIVQSLLDRGCTVVFRRHFAGQKHAEAEAMIVRVNELLAADAAATGRRHRHGEAAMLEPLIATFNSVDAMVSDVSGIVVDFMASAKPLVMYAAQFADAGAFRRAHPSAEAAYVIDRDLVAIDQALDAALGADPLAGRRSERADHYLGGPERAEPAQRFMDLVVELSGQ
ncbi:CDP-glycerol glycerophosphotransferase family protein, partial [Aeromicrobium sp.]|uniref:CDP-glycerol glycerophosphotransferase family protein n=1 Tax=Aeromicrobium sp. TaxID=1871063 RepID=UPI003C378151